MGVLRFLGYAAKMDDVYIVLTYVRILCILL